MNPTHAIGYNSVHNEGLLFNVASGNFFFSKSHTFTNLGVSSSEVDYTSRRIYLTASVANTGFGPVEQQFVRFRINGHEIDKCAAVGCNADFNLCFDHLDITEYMNPGMRLGGEFTIDAQSVNVVGSPCLHNDWVIYVQYGIAISSTPFPTSTRQPSFQPSEVAVQPGNPTVAPTHEVVVKVSIPVKQVFTTSITPEEFNAHANAALRLKQSISTYLGLQPNGAPYTSDNIVITRVALEASTRRWLSGSITQLQRQLVNALEIDYVVNFAVKNVDAATFAGSPALTAMTSALTVKLAAASFVDTVTTDLTTTSADSGFVGFSGFTAMAPVLRIADLDVATAQGAPSTLPTNAPVYSTAASEDGSSAIVIAITSCGSLLFIALVASTWLQMKHKHDRVQVLPDPNNLELGNLTAVTPASVPDTEVAAWLEKTKALEEQLKQNTEEVSRLKVDLSAAMTVIIENARKNDDAHVSLSHSVSRVKKPETVPENMKASTATVIQGKQELTREEEDAMLDSFFEEEHEHFDWSHTHGANEANEALPAEKGSKMAPAESAAIIQGKKELTAEEEEDEMLEKFFAEEHEHFDFVQDP